MTEEDGPAPVDELLGDGPTTGNGERASTATGPTSEAEQPGASPHEPTAEPPHWDETPELDSGPDRRLVVVCFGLLVVAILLLGRRRRRRRQRAEEAG